jgi:hypothetical protein
MKRRAKLSLEQNDQIRKEPPKGFSPTDRKAAYSKPTVGKSVPFPASKTGKQETGQESRNGKPSSQATGSQPAPQPSPAAPRSVQLGESAAEVRGKDSFQFDRTTFVKVLLAVGVTALTIFFLKRRL